MMNAPGACPPSQAQARRAGKGFVYLYSRSDDSAA